MIRVPLTRMMRTPPRLGRAALVSALLAMPTAVAAQEPSDSLPADGNQVTGRIVDSAGSPVQQALLTLSPGNRRTLSDSTGAFVFLRIRPGAFQLEIQHIGFATRTVDLTVEPHRTTHVEVSLSTEAIPLEPLSVQVQHRVPYLASKGFYARMDEGWGAFFDPAWVHRWSAGAVRANSVIEVIVNASPLFSTSLSCGGPAIFLDGFPYRSDPPVTAGRPPTSLLLEMSPTEIGAVEVYPAGQGVPLFAMGDSRCGVVIIWRKRWSDYRPPNTDRQVDLCIAELAAGELTVEGLVSDEFTGVPLPGAAVRADYREQAGGALKTTEVIADHDGWFRLCDLPASARITLTSAVLGSQGQGLVLESSDRAVILQDLDVRVSGPGRVVGRILDRETGWPVSTATVAFGGGGISLTTLSDEEGYFSLEDVMPGDQVLEVTHLGYSLLTDTVSIIADRTVDIRAELSANPIELEPIVITAVRSRRLESLGFYDRRQWGDRLGNGAFFEQEQITQRNPVHISHLARDVPGIEVDCTARGCSIGSSRGGSCDQMSVFLDGVQVIRAGQAGGPSVTIDELVRPVQVAAVEVYPSASSLPGEYSGGTGQCGAVVIWTK